MAAFDRLIRRGALAQCVKWTEYRKEQQDQQAHDAILIG